MVILGFQSSSYHDLLLTQDKSCLTLETYITKKNAVMSLELLKSFCMSLGQLIMSNETAASDFSF